MQLDQQLGTRKLEHPLLRCFVEGVFQVPGHRKDCHQELVRIFIHQGTFLRELMLERAHLVFLGLRKKFQDQIVNHRQADE